MPIDKDTKEGCFLTIVRIFSFIISAAISWSLGASITENPISAVVIIIAGGFIGREIFNGWWNSMKSSSILSIVKALIFTLFTVLLIAGIIIIVLEKF